MIGTTTSSLRPFLLGVGTTLVVVWMVQQAQQRRRQRRKGQPPPLDDDNEASKRAANRSVTSNGTTTFTLSSTTTTTTPSVSNTANITTALSSGGFDAPDLDQRMIRKAEGAIQLRCSRITVVVERCTNDYNYSAILRTVEALGLQHVWIIEPPAPSSDSKLEEGDEDLDGEQDEPGDDDDQVNVENKADTPTSNTESNNTPQQKKQDKKDEDLFRSPGTGKIIKAPSKKERKDRALHHLFARKAMEWLTVREFDTTQDCIDELRRTRHVIWATDLSQQAVCLTGDALEEHYQQQGVALSSASALIPQQLAIVFGTEAVGCSSEMLEASDLRVYLPLRGFADSLNLSVATALVLHQLFLLDPTLVGAMSEEERRQLRQAWFAKLCRQRLLTPSQKRLRYKLLQKIKKAREMQDKQKHGHVLTIEQQTKVDHLPKVEQELATLEGKNHLIEAAIADLVEHPPLPLTDMRRADDHRVCYVGKNTKRRHESDWQDMPATTNVHTIHNATATFFRQRLREQDKAQQQQV